VAARVKLERRAAASKKRKDASAFELRRIDGSIAPGFKLSGTSIAHLLRNEIDQTSTLRPNFRERASTEAARTGS
jgi:hypothetical protein